MENIRCSRRERCSKSSNKDKIYNKECNYIEWCMEISLRNAWIQDKNIWKTIEVKDSKWKTIWFKQWNPETQRYDIDVPWGAISAWGGGWWKSWFWWWTTWATSSSSSLLDDIFSLKWWGRAWRITSPWAQLASWKVNDKVNKFNFIKENLTLEKFVDLKNRWATFGAMSNAEREIVRNSASKLNRLMSDSEWDKELTNIYNRISWLTNMKDNPDWSVTLNWKTYKNYSDYQKGIFVDWNWKTNTQDNVDVAKINDLWLDFWSIFNQ